MASPLVAVTMSPGTGPAGPRAMLNAAYIQALEMAGLLPVLIAPHLGPPAAAAILERVAGVVLPGGADLDPALYGQAPAGAEIAAVSAQRDSQELALARYALGHDLPILAICRGMQILNVALGGSLVQDLAEATGIVRHRQQGPRGAPSHEVTISPGTRLAEALGTLAAHANSLHHQAIAEPGTRVVPVAFAPDGVIEGIEIEGTRWAVGVQWHPEEMVGEHEHARRLFAAFADACS